MKKRIFALAMVSTMGIMALVGCGPKYNEDYSVAMVTDYGDITDESFNQATYEAGKEWCKENNVKFTYYRPSDDSDSERIKSIELAIDKGYNIMLLPGYAFAPAIEATASKYPNVKFIAIDVSKSDLLNAHFTDYDYDPDNPAWASYQIPSNVYCAVYQEEIAGYLAGYAAVKEGYTKFGFLGGMAVPAVVRFGYGYVQGIDDGAEGKEVEIKYVYGNQFFGDSDILAYVSQWYSTGTEVIFACGGGIYTSAGLAAKNHEGKKVIGVDTDQSFIIDKNYGEGITLTSAMKGLGNTVKLKLKEIITDDDWHGGIVDVLGLVSGTDPSLNYVQLPMDTWTMTKFTINNYKALVDKLYKGEITVHDSIVDKPTVSETTSVTYYPNIK